MLAYQSAAMAPDYALGKVYVVRNTVNNKVYVGSTVRTLAQRMAQHRKCFHRVDIPFYFAMREIGVDKFYIELLADVPSQRKEQLHAEEGRQIRALNTLVPNGYNVVLAGRTYAQRLHDDTFRAVRAQKQKEYRINHLDAMKANVHAYYIANQEQLKAYARAYFATNADAIRAKERERYTNNKDAINAKRRERRAAAKLAAAAAPPVNM